MSERDVSPRRPQFSIKPKYIITVILAVALITVVMSSYFVVDQTEQAVVLLFGKVNRIVGPGLRFKLPLGIERNYNVPTQQIQKMEFGFRTQQAGINTAYSSGDYPEESIMLTGDLNIVDVEWIIQYRINDPVKWLFNVEYRQQTLRDISQSVINQLVGDRAILDVIGSERSSIEQQGQIKMQETFEDYDMGVLVTTVKLRNIVPPKGEVQDAFEDVNKAVQDMNRLINEGKEQYNQQIPKARGQAAQLIQEAQGYAAERVNNAQGDVARFVSVLEKYDESPDVTRTRLYIETLEEIFSEDEATDLIDRGLENFIPFKTLQGPGVQATGGVQ
jgi:modulator of FtsH protease HflK